MDVRVLLVEDDAPLRRSLEKYLARAGYAFDSCSTACDALKLAAHSHYDAVIAEYLLPDANGASMLKMITLMMPETTPILISEYDLPAIANDLVKANVRSFLMKPFDPVDLESALSPIPAAFPVDGSLCWSRNEADVQVDVQVEE